MYYYLTQHWLQSHLPIYQEPEIMESITMNCCCTCAQTFYITFCPRHRTAVKFNYFETGKSKEHIIWRMWQSPALCLLMQFIQNLKL